MLTVIIAVGGLGALSHLIVYLTSRELQNWAFAVTAVFQITLAIFKVSHRSHPMYTRYWSEGSRDSGR